MSALIERARILRATIESLAVNLDDEQALDNKELFGIWSGDGVSYVVGDRVRYNHVLYKVLQNHTSQEGWTPESAPSLFAKVLIPDPQGEIPVWEQPSSTSFYNIGDKVHYPTLADPVYISIIDNNVWSPEVTTAWALFEDEDDEPTLTPEPEPEPDPDPEPEPEPSDEIPEYVQPDSTNPYMTGDKVIYNGVVYESLIDNNTWSPEAYPAGWREVIE